MSRRTTAVLAIVLAVLLAGSYLATHFQSVPGSQPDPYARQMAWPDLTQNEIRSISIGDTRSAQAFTASRSEAGGWTIEAPISGTADAAVLDAWLGTWQSMYAEHVITPTGGLEAFGLARPALAITFTTQAGDPPHIVIHVGNQAPAVSGYYARQAGQPAVAVIRPWPVEETRALISAPPLAPTPMAAPVDSE